MEIVFDKIRWIKKKKKKKKKKSCKIKRKAENVFSEWCQMDRSNADLFKI